jgi:actin
MLIVIWSCRLQHIMNVVSQIICDVKEKFVYVAPDFETELQKAATAIDCNVRDTLPDGDEIVIANERFQCPELVRKPSFNGIAFGFDGIDQTLFHSIMKCDIDMRKDFCVHCTLNENSFPRQQISQIASGSVPCQWKSDWRMQSD